MATVLPSETPQFAFADDAEFNAKLKAKQIPPGSILLAGKNFGCGSSREQAVSTLKGHELTIVAEGFARIFLQNSINLGLRLDRGARREGQRGRRAGDHARGSRQPHDGSAVSRSNRCRAARQAIIDAGGLIAYTRKRLLDNAAGSRA